MKFPIKVFEKNIVKSCSSDRQKKKRFFRKEENKATSRYQITI